MEAFPRDISPSAGERHTGLVCPDCGGALAVRAEPPSNRLIFRCRVGHVYAAADMLVLKEERLEECLWTAVYASEELAAFLEDLTNRVPSLEDGERRARIARLRANAQIVRNVITNDRPVKLDRAASE